MKKIFDARIDKLLEIKKHLDEAKELFLTNIVGKNALESVGTATARHASLNELADKVEKLKPIKGSKPTKEQAAAFLDASRNLMLTQKAYEAGITTINSDFDAYVKMTFDFEAKEVEKAYRAIRKRLNVKSPK